jgi:hypothetical protein
LLKRINRSLQGKLSSQGLQKFLKQGWTLSWMVIHIAAGIAL